MKVFFLSLMYSEQTLQEAKKISKCTPQMAPHFFNENLICGFEQCEDVDLSVLNVPPIGSFPTNCKKILMPETKWGNNKVQIGYLNFPYIKHFIQARKLFKLISKQLKKCDLSDTVILMYHTFIPFLKCATKLKKKYPELKVCLIMTDPIPGRCDRAKLMSSLAARKGDKLVELAKCCDSFVLLTEHMTEPLETNGRPYTVVECICDSAQSPAEETTGEKNICLYAGTVDEEYGIKDMAEVFKDLKNAAIWICGGGDSARYLKNLSEHYANIEYFGFVDQKTLEELRDKCDFLINPRRPSGTYTKYSFPSKTAEYMLTGKPVIMYKLEGIPDEYDQYLNYLTSSDISEIKNELTNLFSQDYYALKEKAKSARDFMLKNKVSEMQAKKIVQLFNNKK